MFCNLDIFRSRQGAVLPPNSCPVSNTMLCALAVAGAFMSGWSRSALGSFQQGCAASRGVGMMLASFTGMHPRLRSGCVGVCKRFNVVEDRVDKFNSRTLDCLRTASRHATPGLRSAPACNLQVPPMQIFARAPWFTLSVRGCSDIRSNPAWVPRSDGAMIAFGLRVSSVISSALRTRLLVCRESIAPQTIWRECTSITTQQ